MEIKLYNTLSRTKEVFKPIDPDLVKVYSCGPTVYSEPHIGNFRAFMLADLVRSTLEVVGGYQVKHVMNVTDVGHLTDDGDHGEDKMEKGARKENKTVRELARYYEDNFHTYLAHLNIQPFDHHPRATEYMNQQIAMVQALTKKGYTYVIPNDGIYIDTTKVPDYGKLASLDFEGMNAEYRTEGSSIDTSGKRHATDFSVWKFAPQDSTRQMEWIFDGPRAGALLIEHTTPSQWTGSTALRESLTEDEHATRGFPGWHIECSAMAIDLLGEHIDIHTGGVDHIPVHHTNEIAQAECCLGTKQRVNYRLHQQFLNIDGGKMSKSKGDDLSLPGILAKGIDPIDLRFFYFTGHYRSFLDFSRTSLQQSKTTRHNIIKKLTYGIIRYFDTGVDLNDAVLDANPGKLYTTMSELLADDLDTVSVLAQINTALKDPTMDDSIDILVFDAQILKLNLYEGVQKLLSRESITVPDQVTQLAEQRLQAKHSKDRALADSLRDQISAAGRAVKDTAEGYTLSLSE